MYYANAVLTLKHNDVRNYNFEKFARTEAFKTMERGGRSSGRRSYSKHKEFLKKRKSNVKYERVFRVTTLKVVRTNRTHTHTHTYIYIYARCRRYVPEIYAFYIKGDPKAVSIRFRLCLAHTKRSETDVSHSRLRTPPDRSTV